MTYSERSPLKQLIPSPASVYTYLPTYLPTFNLSPSSRRPALNLNQLNLSHRPQRDPPSQPPINFIIPFQPILHGYKFQERRPILKSPRDFVL